MTDNFFVARLFQMCQENKVNWIDNSEGGFVTQVNGVDIRIFGGGNSYIFLRVFSGYKTWAIREPIPHISQAPAGRFVSWIRKLMGLSPMKGPQKEADRANSEIRANLIAIKNFASDQVVKKYIQSEGYNEEKQELFQQVIYGEMIR